MGFFKKATTFFIGRSADSSGDGRYNWTDDPTADSWYSMFGGGRNKSKTGINVTPEVAQQVAAVYRCCYIFADALTLPVAVYRLRTAGVDTGGMDIEPNHPLHDILTLYPNRKDTSASFWRSMGWHAALRGVAYAEIKPGPRGFVDRLISIHPDRVRPEQVGDDEIRYHVTDWRTGQVNVKLQEEIFRIPGLMPDGVFPLCPSRVGAEAVGLAQALEGHAARIFTQNLNIGGVFTHPGRLSKEGVERLREELGKKFMGIHNLFRPMILQEGLQYTKAAMNARESQLIEERKWQISEISRFFGGVPLFLLGVSDQTNRSTVEEESRAFLTFTVGPFIRNVEQAARHDLLIAPKIYIVKWDMDELARGNMAAQGEFYSKMSGAGGSPQILTVNEIRGALGWNAVTDEHASKLAIGTNPETQPTGGNPAALITEEFPHEPEAVNETVESDSPVSVAEEEVERPALHPHERMGRKEIKALQRLTVKHADNIPAFERAVRGFYSWFVPDVMKALDCPREVAKAWTDEHCHRVIGSNDVNATIDAFERELDEELQKLGENNG